MYIEKGLQSIICNRSIPFSFSFLALKITKNPIGITSNSLQKKKKNNSVNCLLIPAEQNSISGNLSQYKSVHPLFFLSDFILSFI